MQIFELRAHGWKFKWNLHKRWLRYQRCQEAIQKRLWSIFMKLAWLLIILSSKVMVQLVDNEVLRQSAQVNFWNLCCNKRKDGYVTCNEILCVSFVTSNVVQHIYLPFVTMLNKILGNPSVIFNNLLSGFS